MDRRAMTLLIVEDDPSIRGLIVATVPEEWAVVEARDGAEAVTLAREHRPHAAIVDHDLPVVPGDEVCQVLRRESWAGSLRLIALTGRDDEQVRRDFLRAEVDAILTKPFSPVQLLDLIDVWQRI
jgi:DNA-binding response OmpR family regulator